MAAKQLSRFAHIYAMTACKGQRNYVGRTVLIYESYVEFRVCYWTSKIICNLLWTPLLPGARCTSDDTGVTRPREPVFLSEIGTVEQGVAVPGNKVRRD